MFLTHKKPDEVLGIINVNEPIEIFGMMFVTYEKHKRELLNNYLNLHEVQV